MVEDEHRRPLLLEVLITHDVEVNAIDSQQHLRERGGEHIDAAPLAAGQQSPAHGAVGGRYHRPHAQQTAHLPQESATAPALKLQDRPAAFARHLGHLVARVGRPRISDQIHQRDVLVAVGVEVTLLKVDIVLAGELLDRVGLTRSPQDRRNHLAGEHTVIVDLELIGQGVRDTEVASYRVDLNGQRG